MIGLLLAFVLGCAAPVTLDTDAGPAFPHADGYDAGARHGVDVANFGLDACVSCHRSDTSAPSCASCHPAYPHAVGWAATHGAGLGGDTGAAGRADCQTCHGAPGLQALACTGCHASYPHPDGWAGAGVHGVWALQRGGAALVCGSCHGAGLAGEDAAPSCTSCHPAWPHPAGWADPAQHAAGPIDGCVSCHGEAGTGGNSGVACSRCHANFPHPTGWAQGHVAVANKVGQGACTDCHVQNAPALPATCGSACHGGAR